VRRPGTRVDPRALAPLLWALLGLFALRVAGQALVAAFDVPFLPTMRDWYSGLVPYEGTIPVVFHWVLAAFLLALAHHHLGAGQRGSIA
jgi:hypothetical protein